MNPFPRRLPPVPDGDPPQRGVRAAGVGQQHHGSAPHPGQAVQGARQVHEWEGAQAEHAFPALLTRVCRLSAAMLHIFFLLFFIKIKSLDRHFWGILVLG